jgi:hypothetical protein
MTSPPRRPIISLKFTKPELAAGDGQPTAPAKPTASAPLPPPVRKSEPLFKPKTTAAKTVVKMTKDATMKAFAPVAAKPAPVQEAPAATAKPRPARKGPAISPELFKAAVKSAGLAIQNVVADPDWKSEDLLHSYQTAKEQASSTNKQQAKLVSTVATRRHSRDIGNADVENAAMRAAYAAALVTLVNGPDKEEEPGQEPTT